MTDEILKQKERELIEKYKIDKDNARRESLMKKEPQFVSQNTLSKVNQLPKEDKLKIIERVFLNDQITTVKADNSIHQANQIKIKADFARLKALTVGLKYQKAIDEMNQGMHERVEREHLQITKNTLVQPFNLS